MASNYYTLERKTFIHEVDIEDIKVSYTLKVIMCALQTTPVTYNISVYQIIESGYKINVINQEVWRSEMLFRTRNKFNEICTSINKKKWRIIDG